eukprot:scaffold39562_cov57-Phaeocystis_antarctica.AAC.1
MSRISRISRVSGMSPTPSFSRRPPCVNTDGGDESGGSSPASPTARMSFGFAKSFDAIRKATEVLKASREASPRTFTAATPDLNPAVPVAKSRSPAAAAAAAPVQSRSRRPPPSLAPVVAPIVARVRLARGSTRELSTSPPQVAPHSTARGRTQSTQSTAPVRPKPPVPTARSDSTPASRSVLVPAKGLRRP